MADSISADLTTPQRKDGRLSALIGVLDWAEAEAAGLSAREVEICIQLARYALVRRLEKP